MISCGFMHECARVHMYTQTQRHSLLKHAVPPSVTMHSAINDERKKNKMHNVTVSLFIS